MSLESDIKKAFKDNIGKEDKFYKDLSNAIQNFFKKQTLRVEELEAFVQIDSLKTSGDIPVDVKETTILGIYAPIIDVIEKIAGIINTLTPGTDAGDPILKPIQQMKVAAKAVSKDGAVQKAWNFNKDGGVGGSLDGRAHVKYGPISEGIPGADTVESMAKNISVKWAGKEE